MYYYCGCIHTGWQMPSYYYCMKRLQIKHFFFFVVPMFTYCRTVTTNFWTLETCFNAIASAFHCTEVNDFQWSNIMINNGTKLLNCSLLINCETRSNHTITKLPTGFSIKVHSSPSSLSSSVWCLKNTMLNMPLKISWTIRIPLFMFSRKEDEYWISL